MIFLKRFYALILISTLLFASLACRLSSRSSPASTTTPTEILLPAETQALDSPQVQAPAPTEPSPEKAQVKVSVNEDQLTAIVKEQLKDQKDPELEDPQILLRDGQVQVLGNVTQGALTLPLKMAIDVSVDGQGKPHYKIASASLGPLPLPQSTLDQFTTELDKALSENLPAEVHDLFIEEITIADGVMTITGYRR
jgi:hypothetical protein